ncbi:hypothetical protein BLOT_012603 [Blomia tropicalis]|nr:hypothetical protein BLOT_012603 [Blomia tropicalis]
MNKAINATVQACALFRSSHTNQPTTTTTTTTITIGSSSSSSSSSSNTDINLLPAAIVSSDSCLGG